jgi:hypothetical protein
MTHHRSVAQSVPVKWPDISRPSVILPGEFQETAARLVIHVIHGDLAKLDSELPVNCGALRLEPRRVEHQIPPSDAASWRINASAPTRLQATARKRDANF